jgi:hypothetical protein
MRRFILFSLVIFLCAPYSGAQLWKMKRYEATAGIGTSQFYGDVGGYTIGECQIERPHRADTFNVNGSFRISLIILPPGFNLSYIMLHATDKEP